MRGCMVKYIKIDGGLGNQLFQYCFGYSLSCRGEEVRYDISFYRQFLENKPSFFTKRDFLLGKYNLPLNLASEGECQKYLDEKTVKSKVPGFFRKLFRLPKHRLITLQTHEKSRRYDASLPELSGEVFYSGNFITEKYFAAYREELLPLLKLREKLEGENLKMQQLIEKTNSVSLHIRRSDYVSYGYHIASLQYYEQAMAYINAHVENPHYFIFSDDMDWVKANLHVQGTCTYVDLNDINHGYWDLELMRHCKHNIIANSTFSWWGAWLNENPGKIVVAPEVWYVDAEDSKDIVPDSWVKINA